MRIAFTLIFFAFYNVGLFDEFDFFKFTKIILVLLSVSSALSEVLFEASMNYMLWHYMIDEFLNLLKW